LCSLCCKTVDSLPLPRQFFWTQDDVSNWIEQLGFPQYQETFKVNFIDGKKLILVDASALVKMNIKDFDHIRAITRSIREMYRIELPKYDTSISLPSPCPDTAFKLFKSQSAKSYDSQTRCKFFKEKLKLIKSDPMILNHFERLHNWLQHIPDIQRIRIGLSARQNLPFVPASAHDKIEDVEACNCEIPPCVCKFTAKELARPWRLSYLNNLNNGIK
jgi:SAM domain (Sterile alpha motif)